METTGPKVPSRYLSGPTGSCHDHCKCAPKQTTETKPINPFPKKAPKPPADRTQTDAPTSTPRIIKSTSIISKTTTPNFKNNNVVKDQILKKDIAIEPKRRDFKTKIGNSPAKTYNMSSSRTTRRLSDISIPNRDMSLPLSRFPKRRLSEIIIHPNTNIASISNVSPARGTFKKNESRKDSKSPLVNKKFNSLRTSGSNSKVNAKVPPLKTYRSPPKPEVKGSRKSKPVTPVKDTETEGTLVNELNNGVEVRQNESQSQSKKSSDCAPSTLEVKAMKDDPNGVVEPSQTSVEDDIIAKDDLNGVVESSHSSVEDDTAVKDDQSVVVESSPPSMVDDTSAKDDQNEVVEPSPPSMEDDIHAKDDQNEVAEPSSSSLEDDTPAKDVQNEGVEPSPPSMEDDTPTKDDQNNGVQPSPTSMAAKDDQKVVVESSSPSMEDDTPAKYGQQDDNVSNTEVNDTNVKKSVVESENCSLEDLTFRRGTILSPESEDNSPTQLQFMKGKELEVETGEGENISLRRLSSDGVVSVIESQSINVDLKHKEMEEKKAQVLINNVIEETASKLIQTRKSKVKALVGAFETIVSSKSESL